VKFASIDDRGYLQGDSNQDYAPLFAALPGNWMQTPLGMVETRREYLLAASQLSDGESELVAVEHETGIELILIPVVTGLLTEAIASLIK
jgi:hypothetical protein